MPELRVGSAAIPYEIRLTRRAKHLRIVVEPDGVRVVAPPRTRTSRIVRFVESRRLWIAEKQRDLRARSGSIVPRPLEEGAEVLLRGRRTPVSLVAGPTRVALVDGRLRIPLPAGGSGAARDLLIEWLREQAARDADRYVARHAPRLGRVPGGVRIRAQKTVWGSCGRHGTLYLNWRLIGAPPAVFEYVVAHELCHLERRDHSPAFWRLVASLLPDYAASRRWLTENGLKLS